MNPEDVIEAFVSTIILGVLLVVAAQLFAPDIGQILIGILPGFIEMMMYLLLIGVVVALLYQLVE